MLNQLLSIKARSFLIQSIESEKQRDSNLIYIIIPKKTVKERTLITSRTRTTEVSLPLYLCKTILTYAIHKVPGKNII